MSNNSERQGYSELRVRWPIGTDVNILDNTKSELPERGGVRGVGVTKTDILYGQVIVERRVNGIKKTELHPVSDLEASK